MPPWSERDAWLIAYPDQFGPSGLRGVREVVGALAPTINGVHVLPFHPSSSDGGFSVEDYSLVDPAVGSWDDLTALAGEARVMADAVINHVSARGTWFREHLGGAPNRADFFREVPEGTDLGAVVRPRPGPPVTEFTRTDGSTADYWTTFGPDQVDLDYRSPEVLLAVCEAVFRYVAAGASAIRLDAVAFLGKDPGTSSMHRPETHRIVAVLRDCLREIDPGVVLVTETNVPHDDNVTYLGSPDRPEAHAVYQFTLAPLVLHALQTGDAGPLVEWAKAQDPATDTTALNFLASHDGVGLRPAKGWLDPDQVAAMAARCRDTGGQVNEAATATGTEPYELAATWRSLCTGGMRVPLDDESVAARVVVGHSVALALAGIPLLYALSLAASTNDEAGAAASGIARDLNRRRFASPEQYLDCLSGDPVGSLVWPRLREMLEMRRRSPAFHPNASQRILAAPAGVIAIARGGGDDGALVIANLGATPRDVDVGAGWFRIRDGEPVGSRPRVGPWRSVWLSRTPRPDAGG